MMFGGNVNDKNILRDINKKNTNPLPIIIIVVAVVISIAVVIYIQLRKDNGVAQTIAENVLDAEQNMTIIPSPSPSIKPLPEGLNLIEIAGGIFLDSENLKVILDRDSIEAKEFNVKKDLARKMYEIAGLTKTDPIEQIFGTDEFQLVFIEESSVKLISYSLYLTDIIEDDYYYYVNFYDPRDRYETILVLDPGHGGEDVGAPIGEIYEKDIDLKIAQKVNKKFEDNPDSGITVVMTRDGDSYLTLEERVSIANEIGDIFVSIHSNSFEADTSISGVQTHFLPNYTHLKSELLAANIQNNIVKLTGAKDRGIDSTNTFYVINHSLTPSTLIEAGYMTNKEELDKLMDDKYLDKIAEGIYLGIIESCEGVSFRDKDFFGESFYN